MTALYPRPQYILVLDISWDFTGARIACKHMPDCKVLTLNMGRPKYDYAYSTFMDHLTDLKNVYESLIDEKSRKTFYGYWLGMISHRLGDIVYANTPHYITEGFIPKSGDTVIEAGAYDGGSASFLAEMGCKVYTFEMNAENFNMTKEVAAKKGFTVENYGLSDFKGTLGYTADKLDMNSSNVAKITTVDSYVRENNIPRVDFIKLDVEGAEINVLRGAALTIARWKPLLALSAYHKLDDFWTLMNFVKSIRSDYEFALRQYPETFEDMPSMVKDTGIQRIFGLEPDWRGWGECVLFAR